MNKTLIFLMGAYLVSLPLISQNTILQTSPEQYYREGTELLQKGQYGAARLAFENYLEYGKHENKKISSEYYLGVCALNLFQPDSEKIMERFVKQNPNHPKAANAYFQMGGVYFERKLYQKAIASFDKIDPNSLSNSQMVEINFKMGYSYFIIKKYPSALKYFNKIKKSDHRYTAAANYYAGYLLYKNEDYSESIEDLREAEKNDTYKLQTPFLIANSLYKQQKYEDCIAYIEKVLPTRPQIKDKPRFDMLLGECYYQLGNYTEAAIHLESYRSASRKPLPAEVIYRLAFSQYLEGENQKALNNFNIIAFREDRLGQNASYYLGLLYLKQEKKQFAQSAFQKAGREDFDIKIKEEALLNLAKTKFELSLYEGAILVLTSFLQDFPTSVHQEEVQDLLSESYLLNQNYQQAIDHIEGLPNRTFRINKVYQKVTFLKGTQHLNQDEPQKAIVHFKKSLTVSLDQNLYSLTHLWLGESYSTIGAYGKAIESYNQFFLTDPSSHRMDGLRANYGLGYAYFNEQDYPNALVYFKDFVEGSKKENENNLYEDAILRLADCYYVNKGYSSALNYYNQVITENYADKDYALFQMGMIQGIQLKIAEAKNSFDLVIDQFPQSRYVDDALFQTSQLDFEQGNYPNAVDGFTRLINEKPSSEFTPFAYYRRGLAQFNQKEYSNSAVDYQEVLTRFSTHTLANSALVSLQETYSLRGQSEEFHQYLEEFKKDHPSNTVLEQVEFESAKNLYFDQKYDLALQKLQLFMDNYPNSNFYKDALYYSAESYYRLGDPQTLAAFKILLNNPDLDRITRIYQRIADLEYQEKNYDSAIYYYRKLGGIAKNKKQEYRARAGLMESHFQLENHDSVHFYADKILSMENVMVNSFSRGSLYKGKSSMAQGRIEQATDQFLLVINKGKDIYGAEAQYMLALLLYGQNKFQASLETLYDLNINYSSFEEWIGRSFLLIADNFMAMDQLFQAKETLNSIIANSPREQIVKEARSKLKWVEELEYEKTKLIQIDKGESDQVIDPTIDQDPQ